jgi:hypothetical protein
MYKPILIEATEIISNCSQLGDVKRLTLCNGYPSADLHRDFKYMAGNALLFSSLGPLE